MTVLTLDIKDDLLEVNEYDSSIIGLDNRNYVLDSVNEDVDTIEITGFGDYNVTYNNSIDCIEDNAHVQIQKQYTVNPDNLTIKYDNYGNLLIETNIPNDYLGNYWGNDPTNENEGTRVSRSKTTLLRLPA